MDWACSFLSNIDRIWGYFQINRTMCRQIHGQTLQDDATCPAPHMSQLVANHHILTEHGRILSDDHSPKEFLSGWMGQQVQSSVKSRKSNVRQACNRPYPLSLGVLPLAVAGLCSYETWWSTKQQWWNINRWPPFSSWEADLRQTGNIRLGKINTLGAAYRIQTLWGTDPRITEKTHDHLLCV